MGGLPAAAVVPAEHDYAIWEKRVDALLMLLSNRDQPLVSTDETSAQYREPRERGL